ncbi:MULTISPECIES: TraR/DksA family transcriptional regulator [unclassified Streptomyces]|uniref:TraR/DksA family transcriptional regulator n=1 Tax=unclassified Streptomyces TaxID=2593676 RepID=UPI0006AFABC7|nr:MULTISPECIES: TraR/DksA C4-type zinc finger protein [unclassified Streptomyces]KOU81285.1 DNA-binding protein [Streptomyces sp. XY58]KOV02143.1 DNA-binding protein [Streptomyces sp. XY37]KOV42411.1 DNA-binding protein [Streptomyces sp. MMG1064]
MVAKKTAVSGDPAPAKKATAAGKATAKKAPAKKASANKTAAANQTAVAGKAPAGKATAAGKKTTAVRKTTAVEKRTATAKKAGAEGAAHAAKETGVRNVVAKKSTGAARKTAAAATSGLPKTRVTAAAAAPGELAVRPGEDPWTPQEVEEARAELVSEVLRLRAELDASEVAISGLMRDSGDGAGDDQADTGTKNITRESELALAANASSMLEQTERALERLEAGTYGLCENCGKPIGKARMQAFPRATLCVDCKQKQERRH